jgi:4-diphosphocytidyl-2C-methyl-D-erythritol kinase
VLADVWEARGTRHALVSGSGPTVFGCYDDFVAAEAAAWRLRARHPGAVAVSGVGAAVGEPDRMG